MQHSRLDGGLDLPAYVTFDTWEEMNIEESCVQTMLCPKIDNATFDFTLTRECRTQCLWWWQIQNYRQTKNEIN